VFDPPTDLEQAEAYRYGTWAGEPNGRPYNRLQCAYQVAIPHSYRFCQCARNNGHGPAGLYCKQHATKVRNLLLRLSGAAQTQR